MSILAVPYRSQEDQDAGRYRNDCGTACAGMLLDFFGIQPHRTTNELSAMTSLLRHDNGLSCDEVAALLVETGCPAVAITQLDLARIEYELTQNDVPVIALIHYGAIPDRQNIADAGGHFVVVTSIDTDQVFVNDPDFWGAQRDRGHNLPVTRTNFARALGTSPAPWSGIVPKGTSVEKVKTWLVARDARDVTLADKIDAIGIHSTDLAVALGAVVAAVKPGPAHTTTMAYIRSTPAGLRLKLLDPNTNVMVESEAPRSATIGGETYVWVKCHTDHYVGFIADAFLCTGNAP